MASRVRGSGPLRERLHFQTRKLVDDGFGTVVPGGEFETQFTAWAALVPRVGGEEVTAARLGGRQPYVCTVRWSSLFAPLTPAWRLVDAHNPARVMAVTSPPADPDGKRQWLEFIVVDGVPA